MRFANKNLNISKSFKISDIFRKDCFFSKFVKCLKILKYAKSHYLEWRIKWNGVVLVILGYGVVNRWVSFWWFGSASPRNIIIHRLVILGRGRKCICPRVIGRRLVKGGRGRPRNFTRISRLVKRGIGPRTTTTRIFRRRFWRNILVNWLVARPGLVPFWLRRSGRKWKFCVF